MLKIHKGLKKKKKDKKHKRKGDDDLFDEEELERYRKEHQQQLQHQGEEQGTSNDGDTSNAPSSTNSDEWQKFKALTAGIDCVLQKTQEDLDRIKSTSFFQRKPVPSETPKVAEDSQHRAEESGKHTNLQDSGHQEGQEEDDPELVEEDLTVEEEEPEEEEEDIFNTSYVDAVASGELKLAYIPDSPTEEPQEGDDPFDTSIADKFIVNNPKKRYLNLGCAVQVLSGRVDSASTTPAVVASSAAKRRIVRPVKLLLDSFDEGTPATDEPVVASLDSPLKTLLDEDPADFGDRTPACEIPPLAAVVAPVATVNEILPTPKRGSQSPAALLESLSLAEFEILPSTTAEATFKQDSIDSFGSIDDEFAELAQARKSTTVVAATTPTAPGPITPVDPLAVTPITEVHGPDPFDTSIVDKIIGVNPPEESHLLGHHSVSVLSAIEDDDFDPRADDFDPTTDSIGAVSTQVPVIVSSPVISPTSPTLPILDAPHATVTLLTEDTGNDQELELDDVDDYDPFDTSHISTLNAV